jgi:uncharacterized protein
MEGYGSGVLAWCAASLILAGTVKGVVGIGIPLVSISLLTFAIPVSEAVILLPVAIIAANLWQAFAGGWFVPALRRFWPLTLAMLGATVLGARLLTVASPAVLYGVTGLAVTTFVATSVLNPRLRVPPAWERPMGVAAGTASGLLGGMTTLHGPPVIMYLVALHLDKDEFVGTIGTLYLLAGICLLAALAGFGAMGPRELMLSATATVPIMAGVLAGQGLRRLVSQVLFRRILLGVLALVGLNLLRRALT